MKSGLHFRDKPSTVQAKHAILALPVVFTLEKQSDIFTKEICGVCAIDYSIWIGDEFVDDTNNKGDFLLRLSEVAAQLMRDLGEKPFVIHTRLA